MHRLVFTLIMRLTGNRETALELTLDVLHDLWRRARHYDPANGTVIGWIMNQARSRAIDRLRLVQPFREESRALRAAVMGLTPQEREVIEAAFFSGMTHAEVAAHLNQPLDTVKTRIRSGLHKLRFLLAAEPAKA
jgi:RNA polymerase sigma-70 factor (ECF subfamily)